MVFEEQTLSERVLASYLRGVEANLPNTLTIAMLPPDLYDNVGANVYVCV